MLLIIDNYDSFTYNLVQYFGEMGAVMEIRRNDQITLDEIGKLRPDHICISPGPCTPKEAGISCAVIEHFGKSTPLLGVCLGHQAIGHVFGGEVIRADRLMHGKASLIRIYNGGTFAMRQEMMPFGSYSLGVRVAAKDLDDDGRADILFGSAQYSAANGKNQRVTGLKGTTLAPIFTANLLDATFNGGIFVG